MDAGGAGAAAAARPAPTVPVGGGILTMKGLQPVCAQALTVRDGRIVAVATIAAVRSIARYAVRFDAVLDGRRPSTPTGLPSDCSCRW